ncbi:uncharacterized protein LOC130657978 [Hydractinia symbiolongicarpus]|uniref:uncharacterized protein LOC130657978 n=1 Tax=Hydractinia symbiolongicarpus TaxID=13093 RepID=UPI00254AD6AD|nr:uncharacterized protein LOC130657978 [Hydractinia symbiolongicarpus]
MVDSGIRPTKESMDIYDLMSRKKGYDYSTFIIAKEGGKDAVVPGVSVELGKSKEKYGDEDLKGVPVVYHALTEELKKATQACFALVYVPFVTDDGRNSDKFALITWIPETTTILLKMSMSSTKLSVIKKFSSALSIEAHDEDDLKYKEIASKVKKSK